METRVPDGSSRAWPIVLVLLLFGGLSVAVLAWFRAEPAATVTQAPSPPRASAKPPRKAGLVGALSDVAGLDPAYATTPAEEMLTLSCLEGLTVIDPTTGQPAPGAADSWTTSREGRTWTFKLRPAVWTRKLGDAFEDQGPVTASDFVAAWLRLVDPKSRSPHSHALDFIPDARICATEGGRSEGLMRVVSAFRGLAASPPKTLLGDTVRTLVEDEDIAMRRWCAGSTDPTVLRLLEWPRTAPCPPEAYVPMLDALEARARMSTARVAEARAHLGVDRGFYAKDDRTLVVEVPGESPWLPSLLARGALVPVRKKTVDRRRELAFQGYDFAANGAYVSRTEFPSRARPGGEKHALWARLERNPHWWRAATVTVPDVQFLVAPNEIDAEEAVRLYEEDSCDWLLDSGRTSKAWSWVRDARDPAWKAPIEPPRPGAEERWKATVERTTSAYRSVAADMYAAPGAGVACLVFRCAPPFDRADARRALAATLDRATLVKAARGPTPPIATRFVPDRITGALASRTAPAFDAAMAQAWAGSRSRAEGQEPVRIVGPVAEAVIVERLAAQTKEVLGDDVVPWTGEAEDLRRRLGSGAWDVALEVVRPRFDDPLALLAAYTSENPVGGTAWSNSAYDALVRAAFDVRGFLAAPDPTVGDSALLHRLVAAVRPGDAESLEALRRGLLAEAETILLTEAVVVPLWTTLDWGAVKERVRRLSLQGPMSRGLVDSVRLGGVTGRR